jgi:hypothetical protein
LAHATDKAEAAAPEATEAATTSRRIAGMPTHGYEPTAPGRDEFDFAECPLL